MSILGNVVDDYRRRFLCFRLKQPTFPIFSTKDVIDKYDKRLRKTERFITKLPFDCYCLHKQYYCLLLTDVYGSFFDSAKAAIIDSELLPPNQTPPNEWCTEHNRCYFATNMQYDCFCKDWNYHEERVERVIRYGECLLAVSSTNAYVRHYQYVCKTCGIVDNECICRNCMLTCHEGHNVNFLRYGW